jgi:hypothetical protein
MVLRVKLADSCEGSLARVLDIGSSRGSFQTPTYAVSVGYIDGIILKEDVLRGIVELPIHLSFKELGRAVRDVNVRERIERKVNSLARRTPGKHLAVLVPILEVPKGMDLESLGRDGVGSYVEQAVELSYNPRADVVCAPVFQGVPEHLFSYVIEGFLKSADSFNAYLAPSIPYASRSTLSNLVNTYRKYFSRSSKVLPNFICVDYNNSNAISRYSLHNYVLTVLGQLEGDYGEPVAVFGTNVNYSRVGLKYREVPARDLASYFVRLDIIGPNHKVPRLPPKVVEQELPKDELTKRKLLRREDYVYVNLKDLLELPPPEVANLMKVIKLGRELPEVIKRINTAIILTETDYLRERVFRGELGGNPLKYLESKRASRIDPRMVEVVRRLTERYTSKSKTLSDYVGKG